ncbi:MAG: IS3 family transposase [Solirubrobacteraceae bacterium]
MAFGEIKEIHEASGGTYGAPRVHAELALAHGIGVGRKRVERLMVSAALQGIPVARKRRTTVRVAGVRTAPDLVERDFDAAAPERLWCADITYLSTWEGWLYLASVLDCYSRRIVGWCMRPHMRLELVERALQTAVARRHPARGVVHHSDHGSQLGHPRDGAQLRARLISALLAKMVKERAADQLALREAHNQLPRRHPAPADLDRPRAALPRKLRVDRGDQPETAFQIPDHRQPAMPGQRPVVRPHHDPSALPATFTHTHPLGDARSASSVCFSHHNCDSRVGRKGPAFAGPFHATTLPPRWTAVGQPHPQPARLITDIGLSRSPTSQSWRQRCPNLPGPASGSTQPIDSDMTPRRPPATECRATNTRRR